MAKSRKSLIAAFSMLALLLAATSGNAWAGAASDPTDVLKVKINEVSPGIVALTEGGSPLAQAVFSESNQIVVRYNLVANSFPTTPTVFGTFNLGLAIEAGTGGGGPTQYPRTVELTAPGGAEGLVLTPSPSSFVSNGQGQFGPSSIAMSINCPGCANTNGEEIKRQLQFAAGGGSGQLTTNVKVQVIVTLVHPTSCLNLYSFLTDQGLTTQVNATEVVVVKSGKNAGRVNATTPFGQFSKNVLLANICEGAEQFDLRIELDPSFDTNPSNNPGNAVFTYFAGEIIDPTEAFNVNAFSSKTPQGQMLCLANISLPAGESFLATVHMGIQRGNHQDSLASDGDFNFLAKLYPYGLGCTGDMTDSAEAIMTYTIK